MASVEAPLSITRKLSRALDGLSFGPPVSHVYNPLAYARAPFELYLKRYGLGSRKVLFLGMNPGPFGMAQTGVPFGEVSMVRDWLGIEAPVKRPESEHPKRPVQGFACPRREVSGSRLWGWAAATWGTADRFFASNMVYNYCPLCFMDAGGRNLTPDKLQPEGRAQIEAACDRALAALVAYWQPAYCVGVGQFAEKRFRLALPDYDGQIGVIPHPSPANPAANRGWAPLVAAALEAQGIPLIGV